MKREPVVIEETYGPAAFRYVATFGDYDLDDPTGLGATPEEATENLYDMTDSWPSMAQTVWEWVRKYGVAILVSVGFWWLMVYVLMGVL